MVFTIISLFYLSIGHIYPTHAASPPSHLSYQGRLTDSSGNAVSTGTYGIVFSIYTTSSGGSAIWQETQNVYIANGLISTMLGADTALNLDFNSATYYLGVKVGTDDEMSPRRQIGAAPYSINSKTLDGAEAGTGANNILKLDSGAGINIGGTIRTTNNLYAGTSTLNSLTVTSGLTVQGGSISLPAGSIKTADLANGAITADKLYVAAINSQGKLIALTSTYLANLDGSTLTGVVATDIADGAVTNAKVSNTAAIAYSKLNLTSSIQGSDLAGNIAITTTGTANFTGTFQLGGVSLTSSATELNILDGATLTTTELNYVDGVTSSIQPQIDSKAATVHTHLLVAGATDVTASAVELNILDGATLSTVELNILDGATISTSELNVLDGITATTAELNILDGVTSTAVELNILDGATLSTTELNYVDGVTSAIQTQLDNKSAIVHTHLLVAGATDITATAIELNVLDGITSTTAELNTLDGYGGNFNDFNILSGAALAGVTSIEFQYINGVTSGIQGQLDGKLSLSGGTMIGNVLANPGITFDGVDLSAISTTYLPLAGGTMVGNIAMGDNSITGIDTLTFTDTAGTIAGIQNQNLLDKSDSETISGTWDFTGRDSFTNSVPNTGGQVLSILQNSADVAVAERSALNVRTMGTSANDNIILGKNWEGVTAFSVGSMGFLTANGGARFFSNIVNPVLQADNGSGINDIVQFKDNNVAVFTIADGGVLSSTSAVAATGGSVASIIQSTNDAAVTERSVLRLTTLGTGAEDYLIQGYGFGGSTFAVRADGNLRAAYTSLTSSDATVLTVNNGTGGNDIAQFQDNGISVFTIANEGTITATGNANYNGTASYLYTAAGAGPIDLINLNMANNSLGTVRVLSIAQSNVSTQPIDAGIFIQNMDADTALTRGIAIQDIGGGGITTGIIINGATTAIDISGAAIGTGISLGANSITGTNFSVTGAGVATATGLFVSNIDSASAGNVDLTIDAAGSGNINIGNSSGTGNINILTVAANNRRLTIGGGGPGNNADVYIGSHIIMDSDGGNLEVSQGALKVTTAPFQDIFLVFSGGGGPYIQLKAPVYGDNTWSGSYTGSWTNANPSVSDAINVTNLVANDLVMITPTSNPIGIKYWATAGVGSFTVSSGDGVGAFQETMDFNWIVIKQ